MQKDDLKNQITKTIEKKILFLSEDNLNKINELITEMIKGSDTYNSLVNLLLECTNTVTISFSTETTINQVLQTQNILIKILATQIQLVNEIETTSRYNDDFKEFVSDIIDSMNTLIDNLEDTLGLKKSPKISIETVCPEGFNFTETKLFLYLNLTNTLIDRIFNRYQPDTFSCISKVNKDNTEVYYTISFDNFKDGSLEYQNAHKLITYLNRTETENFRFALKTIKTYLLTKSIPLIEETLLILNNRIQTRSDFNIYSSPNLIKE